MKLLRNARIGARLMVGYVTVALLLLIVICIGYSGMQSRWNNQHEVYDRGVTPIFFLGNARAGLYRMHRDALQFVLSPQSRRAAEDDLTQSISYVAKNIAGYRSSKLSEDEQHALARFDPAWKACERDVRNLVLACRSGDARAVGAFLSNTGPAEQTRETIENCMTELVDTCARSAKSLQADMDNTGLQTVVPLFVVGVLGVVFCILAAIVCSASIVVPLKQILEMIGDMAHGRLDMRLNLNRHDEIGELAAAVDAFAGRAQRDIVGTMKKIAVGDLSAEIEVSDELDEVSQALRATMDTMHALNDEMHHLALEYKAGNTDARIPVERFQGEFRAIVEGFNVTLGSLVLDTRKVLHCVAEFGNGNFDAPLEQFPGKRVWVNHVTEELRRNLKAVTVVADYVDRISRGEIPAPISESYNGYFDTIKNNLNTCIAGINRLVAESGDLSRAAVKGELATRADVSAHQGDFRKIVEGVNETLNAVISPIDEATRVLERVAAKDLTARMVGDYMGDHARIKNALNTAIENLERSLEQVSNGAAQVASAAGQISAGSQTLSRGASQQASALEEISSSLQEMTSMTRQNSANAGHASSMARDARIAAERGAESMLHLSKAIDRIKSSSDQTAKIVKTIDEIAFQTNLLALNAAVEAARAGDAGKGFAVVAEEVRSLAMRSAEAAKSTSEMIEEAVHNAEGGVTFNHEVDRNLREINEHATKVTDVLAEIAAASQQQSQGIQQVTLSVEEMDKVTQENAANAEESASASEELTSQAVEMLNMVAGFKITGDAERSAWTPNVGRLLEPRDTPRVGLGRNGNGPDSAQTNRGKPLPFHDDDDFGTLQEF